MPELPDISAYLSALEERIVGQPLEHVRIASAFLLRTAQPPVTDAEGHRVRELRRIGKRIAIGLDNDVWLVLHLMIAGRLHWRPRGAKLAGRNNLAAFDFPNGSLVLTEAGMRFAHLETDARKKLFAEHLMNYVPVMGLIRRVLDERPSHTAPEARFRNELEDYMAEDQADETLKTIVSWARYAELFAYDEQSELFSLENPH